MFINCPIVRLQVGFVQIHVCCVLTLKYVNRIQSMFTELNLVTGQSGKNLVLMLKIQQTF